MNTEEQQTRALFQAAVKSHIDGDLTEALTFYRKVVQRQPDHATALNNMGVIYLGLQDDDNAIRCFQQSLSCRQDDAGTLNNLATALKNKRQYEKSLETLERALSTQSDFTDALFNLGNIYREIGDYRLAVDAFEKAAAQVPEDHEVLNTLGSTLLLDGRTQEALQVLRRSIALKGDDPSTYYHLGNVLAHEGRFEEAIGAFQEAIRLNPYFSEAYLNMGNIMAERGEFTRSVRLFAQAVDLNSASAAAYYNLGLAQEMEGNVDGALKTANTALRRCPNSIQSWVGGARLFMRIGDWQKADPLLDRMGRYAFTGSEQGLLSESLLMFHSIDFRQDKLHELHCLWGDHVLLKSSKNDSSISFSPERPRHGRPLIRVGYVSPDFCRHSVGWLFKQILEGHDPEACEITCYAAGTREDDLTELIKKGGGRFRRVTPLSTKGLLETIHRDQIDILVDLAGHTRGNRLDVFAARAAPVQVTALGYPNGTGLSTMDYRITDQDAESPSSKPCYREKLVFLPGCFLPLGPVHSDPGVIERSDLGLPDGRVVLVSFNRADKLHSKVLCLWDRLLSRCPTAVLALGCGYGDRQDLRSNILSYFTSGNNSERVFFLTRARTEELHRARYRAADLALDPFPYSGTTSTYEALRMAVPVITMVGDRHVQRTTYSILRHLGITETIADSEEAYVETAVRLIESPDLLQHIKMRIKKAFQHLDDEGPRAYTKKIEDAYRIMLERWRRGEPATDIQLS